MIAAILECRYVLLAVALLSAFGTWKVTDAFAAKAKLEAVEAARKLERDEARIGYVAEKTHLDVMQKQQEKADGEQKRLQDELRTTGANLAACHVAPSIVGLLNQSSMPASAGDSAKPEPAKAQPPTDTSAATVIESCQANYVRVCIPEADDRQALKDWYNALRERTNGFLR